MLTQGILHHNISPETPNLFCNIFIREVITTQQCWGLMGCQVSWGSHPTRFPVVALITPSTSLSQFTDPWNADRLKEITPHWGKGRAQSGLGRNSLFCQTNFLPHHEEVYEKDGDVFSWTCCNRTKKNGFKLKESRLRLDKRKKGWGNLEGFPERCWMFPGKFQARLKVALSNPR